MAKPVSMNKAVQTVRDAYEVAQRGLPATVDPAVVGAVAAVIAREFLDKAYVNDLGPLPEDGMPRPAG
jgi:hypothetical protein